MQGKSCVRGVRWGVGILDVELYCCMKRLDKHEVSWEAVGRVGGMVVIVLDVVVGHGMRDMDSVPDSAGRLARKLMLSAA